MKFPFRKSIAGLFVLLLCVAMRLVVARGPDRFALLEARLAKAEGDLASMKSPPVPVTRALGSGPATQVPWALVHRGLMAIGGPLIGLRGPPIFGATISVSGGVALGDSPTWTGVHTFSADAAFNGGTGAVVITGNASIDGSTDVVQFTVQGNATQTSLLFVAENSAGIDQFTVSNTGVVTQLGALRFTDDNVSITESGTNDLVLIGDNATRLTISDGSGAADGLSEVAVAGDLVVGGVLRINDNNIGLLESGTNDLDIVADGVFIVTVSGVAANPTALTGQIAAAHMSGGGGLTTGAATGTGCGTASAPTQAGTDISGTLGATCGSAGTTTNPFVTITFADAYSTAPFCTITPMNAATAAGVVLSQHVPVTTTTTLAVNCGGGTCTTGTLLWSYSCSQ